MDLTDSFTWEDLPNRDPDTGHLTAAGWIPLIKLFTTRIAIAITLVHIVLSIIRIVTSHETLFIAWYPFDWTVSPFYEVVNISQVTIYIYKNDTISLKVLHYTELTVSIHSLSFFLPFSLLFLRRCQFARLHIKMKDNEQLESIWKEALLFELRHYLGFSLQRLWKIIKTVRTSGVPAGISGIQLYGATEAHTVWINVVITAELMIRKITQR
jgi:hypothetical protein